MQDKDFCRKQVRRLGGLDFFPDDSIAAGELITALQTAPSEQAAVTFVDDWLSNETRAPKKAEIIRLLYERNSQARRARESCELCRGSTWVGRDYIVTYYTGTFKLRGRASEPLPLDWRESPPKLEGDQAILGGATPCPNCRPNYVRGAN